MAYLEQVGALSWAQTADILHQALGVRVSDGLIHINTHLINTVDKFTVKGRQQILLHYMFLRGKTRKSTSVHSLHVP